MIYVKVGFRDGYPEISRGTRRSRGSPQLDGFVEFLEQGARPRTTALVLSGIATSGFVLFTLRPAADLDFSLTLLSDGCIDADDEVHRVLCEKVLPRQAQVLTAGDWVDALAERFDSRLASRRLQEPRPSGC